jgi:hypothetical protein
MKQQIKRNNADDTRILSLKWIDTVFITLKKTLFCRNQTKLKLGAALW